MTVQAGIEWDLLEQTFEPMPCENQAHGESPLHPAGGEATHYSILKCPKCKSTGVLQAICEAAVKLLLSDIALHCPVCWRRTPARLFVQTLEPIH
jgi:hypothetical protein